MELNKYYSGSCFELIKKLPDNFIDLIVTSPPYADIKSYGKKVNVLHPENYNNWLLPLLLESYRVLKPSGSFILNVGDRVVKKHRHTYALDLPGRVVRETRLSFYDRYFWYKTGIPNGSNKRVNNFIEYIYHFVKDVNKIKWDMDRVREEYAEISIKRMKSKMNVYKTKENGEKILSHQKKGKLNPKGKTPDCLFMFPNNSKMKGNKHPAPFSIDLPIWFIKALTDENDIVLDPFMGSGTTAEACIKLKRNFIGFELNDFYIKESIKRTDNLINKNKKIDSFFN
jgi:DNA modification methylase